MANKKPQRSRCGFSFCKMKPYQWVSVRRQTRATNHAMVSLSGAASFQGATRRPTAVKNADRMGSTPHDPLTKINLTMES
jgi:hypothetical protein